LTTLKEAIQAATDETFLSLDSVLIGITYERYTGEPVYDSTTGQATEVLIQSLSLRVKFLEFTEEEKDRRIAGRALDVKQPHEKKLIVNPRDINFEPTLNDRVIDEFGIWQIQMVKRAGGGLLYILEIRRP